LPGGIDDVQVGRAFGVETEHRGGSAQTHRYVLATSQIKPS
jgi:hypothetical protein